MQLDGLERAWAAAATTSSTKKPQVQKKKQFHFSMGEKCSPTFENHGQLFNHSQDQIEIERIYSLVA